MHGMVYVFIWTAAVVVVVVVVVVVIVIPEDPCQTDRLAGWRFDPNWR